MKNKIDIDAIVSNAVEEQFRKERQKEYMRRVLKTFQLVRFGALYRLVLLPKNNFLPLFSLSYR